jgi:hypothetical protein
MKTTLFRVLGGTFLAIANLHIAQADVMQTYNVVETFYEPMTQPNNTIFTGSFTFDSTTQTVSNLMGTLSEAMSGSPMTTVNLDYQLTSVSDGNGGLLVSAFALTNTNVFVGGGFTTGGTQTNGTDNAYATIDVNLSNPTTMLTATQPTIQLYQLSYADCTAGGLMGPTCMTGNGYVVGGTMMATPSSEIISAVPLPAAIWSFLAGTMGLLTLGKKRKDSLA